MTTRKKLKGNKTKCASQMLSDGIDEVSGM
jgi:hypothetical protein